TMSAFDLTNQSMQSTEPEIDYFPLQMNLRDDMVFFVDDKWVNGIYCQPPFAADRKHFSRQTQSEWSIWKENKELWEENRILRVQNRMLLEENKALQCLQSQNKAVRVIYTDATQQCLQKENQPFPLFQERDIGSQIRPGNKQLQVVQGKHRFLEDFHQDNKKVPIICKDQKVIVVDEESKDASSDLQEDTDAITAVEEGSPGPVPQKKHEAKKKHTTPTQNINSGPNMQGEYEILRALKTLYELLEIFLKENHVLGEKQDCHILYDVDRSFQEDYNKLKLQLNAVKSAVSDIRAQMEILERELFAITTPIYEEAGCNLATEHQFEEM
ncbi:SPERT protein, partial [Atlantisia rogersi]|nr:SPERT protein [Atlantisia rogersi]